MLSSLLRLRFATKMAKFRVECKLVFLRLITACLANVHRRVEARHERGAGTFSQYANELFTSFRGAFDEWADGLLPQSDLLSSSSRVFY
jgi:hypothetical protein